MTAHDPERAGALGDEGMWKNLADDASLIDIFKHIVDDGEGPNANPQGGDNANAPVWDALEPNGGLAGPDVGAPGLNLGAPTPSLPAAAGADLGLGSRKSPGELGSGGGSGTGAAAAGGRSDSDGAGSAIPALAYFRDFPKVSSKLAAQRREAGDRALHVPFDGDRFDASGVARRVSAALTEISEGLECGSLLQMFVPTVRPHDVVELITSDDLSRVKTVHGDQFRRYHEVSRAFVFDVSPSSVDSTHGVTGRVFLYKTVEWSPNVCCYRPTEYLRLAMAIDCLVQSSLAFPVFLLDPALEPRAQTPLGVIECLLDTQTTNLGDVFDFVSACVRKHGLFTCGADLLGTEANMRARVARTLPRVAESATAELEAMCLALGLPFAQMWLPVDDGSPRLVTAGAPFCAHDAMSLPYRLLSAQIALLPSHGPVGRAFDQGSMIWVDNVQEGSLADWPLQHATALLDLRGVCACTLAMDAADGGPPIEAVLEVFLPRAHVTSAQQQSSLDALWAHLQRLRHLRMLIDEKGNPTSGRGSGANGPGSNGGAGGMGANGVAGNTAADAFPGPPVGQAGDPRPPWGVTLEMLQGHFNKHLKEAAKDLGVGSTTLKRICRHFGIARWPRRSLKSKQGKLNNAIKTLSAYGSGDAGGSMHGGSMHGGSMLTGVTGTTHGGASMMSMGAPEYVGGPEAPGDGSGDARGQSVHGPLAGGSGDYAVLMNERVGARGVFGGVSNNGLSGTERAENARAASAASPRAGPPGAGPPRGANPAMSPRGGSGFPFPTRDDDGQGSPSAAFRGHSARGGSAFGPGAAAQQAGAEQGGGSRGGSARGGTALLGVKRSVGDVLGARAFFDGGHHAAGFADQPGSKRGMSWHGGTAAASALREDAFPSRLEKTSHGANLAFAHMGLGGSHGAGLSRDAAGDGMNRPGGGGATVARASMQSGSGGSGGAGESFLVDRPPDALTCKIAHGDDVVRMTLTGDMSLAHVVDRLVSSVDADASALRLQYQDEEGEWCALNSDADLQECRVATRALGGFMRIRASSTK